MHVLNERSSSSFSNCLMYFGRHACLPLYSTSATASLNVKEMILAILKLSNITCIRESTITFHGLYPELTFTKERVTHFQFCGERFTHPMSEDHGSCLGPCQGLASIPIGLVYTHLLLLHQKDIRIKLESPSSANCQMQGSRPRKVSYLHSFEKLRVVMEVLQDPREDTGCGVLSREEHTDDVVRDLIVTQVLRWVHNTALDRKSVV